MATTKNLAEAIRRKLASEPELAAAVDAEQFNANVAAAIYQARLEAGLTQKELADRTGMRQSAIARLEDADYDGHSLKTLGRIALALGKRIEVSFVEQSARECEPLAEVIDIAPTAWKEDPSPWPPVTTVSPPSRRNGSVVA